MSKRVAPVLAVIFLLISTHAFAEAIKLKFANYFPPTHMNSVVMGQYCDARWVKASEPVVGDFKKDLGSKGYKASEVDSWTNFIGKRIEYWKAQEKAKKVPTAYQD